jgi:hypothetical protein
MSNLLCHAATHEFAIYDLQAEPRPGITSERAGGAGGGVGPLPGSRSRVARIERGGSAAFTPLQHTKFKPAGDFVHSVVLDGKAG